MLFSATMPSWVRKASKKYMDENKQIVDLVGDAGDQTACGVEASLHTSYYLQLLWSMLASVKTTIVISCNISTGSLSFVYSYYLCLKCHSSPPLFFA